jgi:hypothetical protein
MSKLTPIKELKLLFNALYKGRDLLTVLFDHRNSVGFTMQLALKIDNTDEDLIQYLIDMRMIYLNNNCLKINDLYESFFEDVLGTNEEINIALINQTVAELKKYIDYYQITQNQIEKARYLNRITNTLQKIQRVIGKSIEDLNRNVNNTFKTEPDFKIKKLKLEDYNQKGFEITQLMDETKALIEVKALPFFKMVTDNQLNRVKTDFLLLFYQASHDLVETEKQIIQYINQVKSHNLLIQKLQQLKYLADQHEIKNEAKTNFMALMVQNQDNIHYNKPIYNLKLSLTQLQEYDVYQLIQQIVGKSNDTLPKKILKSAEQLSQADQEIETAQNEDINLFEVHQAFLKKQTKSDLFNFILSYNFTKTIELSEYLNIYCQMISLFETDYVIAESYLRHENNEYAIVYPK